MVRGRGSGVQVGVGGRDSGKTLDLARLASLILDYETVTTLVKSMRLAKYVSMVSKFY